MQLQDRLYKVSEIAKIMGVTIPAVYFRIMRRELGEPEYIDGIAHYSKDDVEIIMEGLRRGRKTQSVIQ